MICNFTLVFFFSKEYIVFKQRTAAYSRRYLSNLSRRRLFVPEPAVACRAAYRLIPAAPL